MFVCQSCRNDDRGTFDFVKGIERLKKDSLVSIEQLKLGVERETLLLKKVLLDATVHSDFSQQRQDLIANAIISQYTLLGRQWCMGTGSNTTYPMGVS